MNASFTNVTTLLNLAKTLSFSLHPITKDFQMERNEACGIRAFGGFDIGLGMGMGMGMGMGFGNDTVGVQEDTGFKSTSSKNVSVPVTVAAGNVPVSSTSVGVDVDRDLVAAARFDFLKKKRMPRFRRGSSGVRSFRPFTSFPGPLSPNVCCTCLDLIMWLCICFILWRFVYLHFRF